MARIDTLTNFFTDVADSIRSKTGKTDPIPCEDFDTEIESIETGGNIELDNASYLFYNNARINKLDELLSTLKDVTNTYYMFYGANNITTSIDLSPINLDTLTNNQSYYYMFHGATGIPNIKIKSNSTVPITIAYMFQNCSGAQSIIADINTSNVTQMSGVFQGCTALKSLDISSFNTEKVTDMSTMFNSCSSLQSIDLSNFNVEKVTTMFSMFSGCSEITALDLSNFNTLKLTDIRDMFTNCHNLSTIIGLNDLNTDLVASITDLFGTSALASTDTSIEGTLDISLPSWTLPKIKTFSNNLCLLRGNKNIRSIDLSFLANKTFTSASLSQLCYYASSLKSITIPTITTTSATSFNRMFAYCVRLETINGLSNINTNSATDITRMFENCEKLSNIDVTHFNVSKVVGSTGGTDYTLTGFAALFRNCKTMTTIDLSTWVANANVRHIRSMFEGCESLTNVSLPDFSAVTGTLTSQDMFKNCKSLVSVDLTNLPLTKLSTLSSFFDGCESLKNVTFSYTSPIAKTFTYMFRNCKALETIDASFVGNIGTNIYTTSMFEGCTNLKSINLPNLRGGNYKATSNMFKDCSSLETITFQHTAGQSIFANSNYMVYPTSLFENCSSLEVLDLRYAFIGTGENTNDGTLFNGCTKLRKLDLRGTTMGLLGSNNSSWKRDVSYFKDVGSDNDTPTIVYTDTAGKQANIIKNANQVGKNWSTDNVIVASLDEVVDMS